MVETPTDEVESSRESRAAPAPKSKPTAGNRYRLFDDDDGDYRIYEILPASDHVPKGTLAPIAEVPGFRSTADAKKFVNNSGDLLNGKQLLILRGLEICSVQVQTVTRVQPRWKPKTPVTGPAATEAGGQ